MNINSQQLLSLLSAPSSLSDETLEALQQAIRQFPYFQLGHALIAKAKHDRQAPDATEALHMAAIYAPSRVCLKKMIYDEQSIDTATLTTVSPSETGNSDSSYPYLDHKKTDDKPSQPDPTNDQQKNQIELIDKFIRSDRDVRIRWHYQEENPKDLTEQNNLSGNMVTENMAEIYIRQEKKEQAIAIYQRLILKYPDKKTYFAEKIESLKQN